MIMGWRTQAARLLARLGCAGAMTLASLLLPAVACAQTQWALATGYASTNFHTENIRLFAQAVSDATQGRMRIDVRPNGSFLKPGEIFESVRQGKADAGEVILSSLAKDIPVAGIDSVPFIVGSYADARVLWQESRSAIDAALEQRGLKLLFAVPWPPQGLYSTRPITRASALRGTRMRTYNPATERIAQLLSAQPVLVQTPDLAAALDAGRIDTLITSSATAIDLAPLWKWFPYFYEVNAWLPKNVVFANKKAFDALDPDARARILKLAGEAEARGWRMSEAKARDYNRLLAEKGTRILSPDPFLVSDFRHLGETLAREWLRAAGNDGLNVLLRYEMNRFRGGAT